MGQATEQLTRLLTEAAANVTGEAFTVTRGMHYRLYGATVTGTGAVAATVTFEGSLDGVNWQAIATALSLSGASSDSESVVVNAVWPQVRAVLSGLSGTAAKVDAFLAL